LAEKAKQTWAILLVADKLRWQGDVQAPDEKSAIAEGARKFNKEPDKLMAVRR
jgi:hypothetical protein